MFTTPEGVSAQLPPVGHGGSTYSQNVTNDLKKVPNFMNAVFKEEVTESKRPMYEMSTDEQFKALLLLFNEFYDVHLPKKVISKSTAEKMLCTHDRPPVKLNNDHDLYLEDTEYVMSIMNRGTDEFLKQAYRNFVDVKKQD
jgi:hypothetical protein